MAGSAILFSSAFSAMGQYKAGKENQKIQNWNAGIADIKAADAIERGKQEGQKVRRTARIATSYNNAVMAAQGLDISDIDATPTLINLDIERQTKEDELVIRANAEREAWGYRVEGADFRLRGKLYAAEGKTQAASTLISGTGGVLYDRYGFSGGDKIGTVGEQ